MKAFLTCMVGFTLLLGACASSPSSQSDHHASGEDELHDIGPGNYSKDQTKVQGDTAVLTVYGMSCPLCANNVDKQLLKLDGVQSAKINLKSGQVIIGVDTNNPPTHAALAGAIYNSGFTLQSID